MERARTHPLGWTDTSWDFAVDDWNGNGWDALYALRRNGASGRTGVHVLADRTCTTWVSHRATPLPRTDGQPWWRFVLDRPRPGCRCGLLD